MTAPIHSKADLEAAEKFADSSIGMPLCSRKEAFLAGIAYARANPISPAVVSGPHLTERACVESEQGFAATQEPPGDSPTPAEEKPMDDIPQYLNDSPEEFLIRSSPLDVEDWVTDWVRKAWLAGRAQGTRDARANPTNEVLKPTNVSSSPTPAEENLREQWPPRLRVRLRERNFYKAGYGGDVALETHIDPLDGRHENWPQYLSLAEHQAALSRAEAERDKANLDRDDWKEIATSHRETAHMSIWERDELTRKAESALKERDSALALCAKFREAAEDAELVMDHALELGYCGEGSTNGDIKRLAKERDTLRAERDELRDLLRQVWKYAKNNGATPGTLERAVKAALAPNADGGGEKV